MVIVVMLPVADDDLCVEQGVEAVDVQALVPDPAVEGLHVPIAPRGTRRDVVQPDLLPGPVGQGLTDQLRAIVAADHLRGTTLSNQGIEVVLQRLACDGSLNQSAEAFAGVLIDHGGDLDRPPLLVGIELEVHRPDHIRGRRCRGAGGGSPAALTAAAHRYSKALLTPEALDLLVVDHPPLGPGFVVGPPVPMPGILRGVSAQPLAQSSVRISCCF